MGIKRHKLPRRPENHGDPGDGRWTGVPRRWPEKRIADQSRRSRAVSFHTEAGHGERKTVSGRASPHGPHRRKGVCFCCICYHCHWGKKKKKVYTGLFPKSFPLSQIFSHLWSKRQFSDISRGPSRLVLAGNRGGQQGPCWERRRFLGLDEDCRESSAPSTRGRQKPR